MVCHLLPFQLKRWRCCLSFTGNLSIELNDVGYAIVFLIGRFIVGGWVLLSLFLVGVPISIVSNYSITLCLFSLNCHCIGCVEADYVVETWKWEK